MIDPENYPKGFPLDFSLLDRMLDKLKAKVFIGNNAAFYGALMCSVNFVWAENIPTASTTGLTISWNPYFFLALDERVVGRGQEVRRASQQIDHLVAPLEWLSLPLHLVDSDKCNC